jgi:hypothetical protein
MSGGMLEIGGLLRFFQRVKRDARADDVAERFGGVGDKRVRMAENTRDQLRSAEAAIDENAPQGRALARGNTNIVAVEQRYFSSMAKPDWASNSRIQVRAVSSTFPSPRRT